ncbi:MAG: hypothetical protein NT049_12870 [Planctomycetota bacterium]|nr:hypothetical protein [Planctomycetota bacterium]
MMISRKMLGLAVTERSITAVEMGVAHSRPVVLHAAEMPMPEGDGSREPAALGKSLRQFLKHNHFSCSRCIIGMGTRWLAAREKSLPPTAADLVAGMLSLAAEREFASDPKDLVLDYTKPADAAQGKSVLLVAAPRQNVNHLLATAEAAGLTVTAITSSTMALASATGGAAFARRLVLVLTPGGAELCVQTGGGFGLLRCLPLAAPPTAAGVSAQEGWVADLAGELRRVLALQPGAATTPQGAELVVWNAAGLSAESLGGLGATVSVEARLCKYPSDLGITEEPASVAGEAAAATALALSGLQAAAPPVDFLHSRLTPRKKFALGRKVVWAGALAAAVVIAILVLLLNWQSQQQEVEELTGQLRDMKVNVDAAKDIVDKTTFARRWYDQRPRFLDCLRELTLAFPAEGRIWTTSVGIGDDMKALLSGKASDESAVLDVLDRLTKSRKFTDVKPLYIREVGGGSSEVSFAISLRFVKAD